MYNAQGALDREQLVIQYAPLVKRIAYHLLLKLPASVHVDDLIQNGMIGLLDASTRYEEGLGAKFETYAVQRIRGSMLDGLREEDRLPRGLRREIRRVEAAIQKLEHQHGRHPNETELADTLGMPLGDYQQLLQDARGHQLLYLEDMSGDDGEDFLERNEAGTAPDPLAALEDAHMRKALVTAIDNLPDREKTLMALYYEEDLNLREIGEVMGVTESRVCQLHSQAVARLRATVVGGGHVPKANSSKATRNKSSEGRV
jgi:RNA polymerase sigma factor for flagellar operon FliA